MDNNDPTSPKGPYEISISESIPTNSGIDNNELRSAVKPKQTEIRPATPNPILDRLPLGISVKDQILLQQLYQYLASRSEHLGSDLGTEVESIVTSAAGAFVGNTPDDPTELLRLLENKTNPDVARNWINQILKRNGVDPLLDTASLVPDSNYSSESVTKTGAPEYSDAYRIDISDTTPKDNSSQTSEESSSMYYTKDGGQTWLLRPFSKWPDFAHSFKFLGLNGYTGLGLFGALLALIATIAAFLAGIGSPNVATPSGSRQSGVNNEQLQPDQGPVDPTTQDTISVSNAINSAPDFELIMKKERIDNMNLPSDKWQDLIERQKKTYRDKGLDPCQSIFFPREQCK